MACSTSGLLAHNLLGPSQRVESVSEVFYVDAFRDERSLRLDVDEFEHAPGVGDGMGVSMGSQRVRHD